MSKQETSALVKSVLALDEYFSELDRLGSKINSLEMKSDFDFEHAERLMVRFAEVGQGVSDEVQALAARLNEARANAEAITAGVAERALLVKARKSNEQEKYEEYRLLGEKVRELSESMANLKPGEGGEVTDEIRAKMSERLAQFEDQLSPLIERAQNLRKEAQTAKIKHLEQSADSLSQVLLAIRSKLGSLNMPQHLN